MTSASDDLLSPDGLGDDQSAAPQTDSPPPLSEDEAHNWIPGMWPDDPEKLTPDDFTDDQMRRFQFHGAFTRLADAHERKMGRECTDDELGRFCDIANDNALQSYPLKEVPAAIPSAEDSPDDEDGSVPSMPSVLPPSDPVPAQPARPKGWLSSLFGVGKRNPMINSLADDGQAADRDASTQTASAGDSQGSPSDSTTMESNTQDGGEQPAAPPASESQGSLPATVTMASSTQGGTEQPAAQPKTADAASQPASGDRQESSDAESQRNPGEEVAVSPSIVRNEWERNIKANLKIMSGLDDEAINKAYTSFINALSILDIGSISGVRVIDGKVPMTPDQINVIRRTIDDMEPPETQKMVRDGFERGIREGRIVINKDD